MHRVPKRASMVSGYLANTAFLENYFILVSLALVANVIQEVVKGKEF